jgi:hypothetical protein
MSPPLPPELLEQLGLDPSLPEPALEGPYELPAPEVPTTGPYELAHPPDADEELEPEPHPADRSAPGGAMGPRP